jgi:CheY-like chemotaxis protein
VVDAADPATAPLPPGRYLEARVTDSGSGIPEPVREHVFDPFFTTKPTGEGCGMGLAVAYAIVRNHQGAIRFHSRVGVGTTFTLHLPLWSGPGPRPAALDPPEVRGEGTILFVDDERLVREAGAALLSSLGYQVIAAESGTLAIDRLRARLAEGRGGAVDLVVLDLSMPGMSGEDCFRALRRLDPAVRVLFSSGYGLDDLAARLGDDPAVGFLGKPYDLAKLSAAVARVLARR